MASHIKRGESLFIPFRDGQSITDSQLKPRMYKTVQAFEKSFPGHYLGTNGVELVEYAEMVHGYNTGKARWFQCSVCGYGFDDIYLIDESPHMIEPRYCAHCGAQMDGDVNGS